METREIYVGDCQEVLANFGDCSIDAVVTDPPYHLTGASRNGSPRKQSKTGPFSRHRLGERGFMGKTWDGGDTAFRTELWRDILRVLKPGGHLLSFGGTRTYHRMACAIEDAGFEIRDQIQWIYGSGFPKSLNVGEGRGTALKPANEPIVLARKPLSEKTVAANIQKWGTGALNIDACRIGSGLGGKREGEATAHTSYQDKGGTNFAMKPGPRGGDARGRFPANVLFDEEARTMLGEPSRFFYCAKASKAERGAFNDHPTVKPLKLMKYLLQLVVPPGGIVLDPFAGSGTTCVAAEDLGIEWIGIEKEPHSAAIARKRIEQARRGQWTTRLG